MLQSKTRRDPRGSVQMPEKHDGPAEWPVWELDEGGCYRAVSARCRAEGHPYMWAKQGAPEKTDGRTEPSIYWG